MNLEKVKRGQIIKIRSIPNEIIRAQALRFGIGEGTTVQCEEIIPAGPVILRKNRQEIAIGRGLARLIKVDLVS